MRMNAIVAGVGMSRFGKHVDIGLKALGAEVVQAALEDSGLTAADIEAAYVGNAMAGIITGQECVRGQVILRSIGIGRIPVINVENACGSGSTAFQQACAMVSTGCYDVVLAAGVEKLYHPDKQRTFMALRGGMDIEELEAMLAVLHANASGSGAASESSGGGDKRSVAMDFYAGVARAHMHQYGTTVRQLAGVSAKNSFHGSLNPRAQFREVLTVDEVLAAPMIDEPLTRPMCSPIGDGAAAAIVVSQRKARELGLDRPVRVAASVLHSGWDHEPGELDSATLCAKEAYEEAGLGPEDLGAIELHDASAIGELIAYESLGLCKKGESGKLIDDGVTKLGGRLPVNTSGGLLRKGHPVGATGIAQIVELTEQLQGRCGKRQVEGAKAALAHNGGGVVGREAASMCVTILVR
ncbi:MAG: thiolase family protein [Deltaproteobacteria bacterium]|nr:thiolase family protein [Deltaproteobacteria bacterium]